VARGGISAAQGAMRAPATITVRARLVGAVLRAAMDAGAVPPRGLDFRALVPMVPMVTPLALTRTGAEPMQAETVLAVAMADGRARGAQAARMEGVPVQGMDAGEALSRGLLVMMLAAVGATVMAAGGQMPPAGTASPSRMHSQYRWASSAEITAAWVATSSILKSGRSGASRRPSANRTRFRTVRSWEYSSTVALVFMVIPQPRV